MSVSDTSATPVAPHLPPPMLWLAHRARQQRLCLVLSVRMGMDCTEIGDLLDIPATVAAAAVRRALDELGSAPRLRLVPPIPAAAPPTEPVVEATPAPGSSPEQDSDDEPVRLRPIGWYRHPRRPRNRHYWDGTGWSTRATSRATGSAGSSLR